MSRHRDIRNLNYDEEYDQAYDDAVYGRSVDDYDYGVSPGMEEYLYSRSGDNSNKFAAYFHTGEDIEEVEEANEYIEDEKGELDRARHDSSSYERPKLSDGDEKKLSSALDEIRNIVGDQFSETEMVRMVLRYKYDTNAAVSALLENSCPPPATKALPQRERRQRNKDSCILQLNSDYAILPYHGFCPVLSFINSSCVKTNVQRLVKDWMLELERKRKKDKTSEERGRVKDDSICSSESISTDTNEESESSTFDKEVEYLDKEDEQEMELEISCPGDEVQPHSIPGRGWVGGEERIDLRSKRDLFDSPLFGGKSASMNVEDDLHSKYSSMSSNNSSKTLQCSRFFPSVSSLSSSPDSGKDICSVLTKSNLPRSDLSALASSYSGSSKTEGSSDSSLAGSQPGDSSVSCPASFKLETSAMVGPSPSGLSSCHLGIAKPGGSSSDKETSKSGGTSLSALASSHFEASVTKDSGLSAISSLCIQPSTLGGSSFSPLACSPKVTSISGSPTLSDLASSHLRAYTSGDSGLSTNSSSNVGIPKLGGTGLFSLASSHSGSPKPAITSLSSLASSHLGSPKSGGTTLSSLASSHLGSPKLGGTGLSSLASSHLGVTRLEGSSFKNMSPTTVEEQLLRNEGISGSSSISSTGSSFIIPALTTNSRVSGGKPGSECRALDSRLGSFGSMNQFIASYCDYTPDHSGVCCGGEEAEARTGNVKAGAAASSLGSLAQLHLSKSQSPKFDGFRSGAEGNMGSLILDRKVEPHPVDYMFFSSPFEDFLESVEKDCEMDDIDLSIAFTKQQEYEKIKPPVIPKVESEIGIDLPLEGCPFTYDENLRQRGPISNLGQLLIKSEFTCKVKQFGFSTIEVDLPVFEFDTPSPDDIVRQSLSEKK